MTFSAFLVVIDIQRACCPEFAVTVMPVIYIDLASHRSPCELHRNMYLAGPSCWVGGRPAGGKDPVAHSCRGATTHNNLFSDGIQMNFGLDKCPTAHFDNGKLSGHNTGVKVGKTETIKGLEPCQVYKY